MDNVQKFPYGLLGSLGINTGQGPRALGDVLQPIMEMSDYYFSPDLTISQALVSGITTTDTGPSITQPAGEIWRVLGMSTAVTPSAAGALVAVSHFIQNPPLSSSVYTITFPSPPTQTIGANQSRLDFGGLFPHPLVLPPGTIYQSATCLAPGGATNVGLSLRVFYQKLRS